MKRILVVAVCGLAIVTTWLVLRRETPSHGDVAAVREDATHAPAGRDAHDERLLPGREAAGAVENAAPVAELPSGLRAPRDEAELRELVAWMRSLPPGELLRASHAEYRFRDSDLVRMLQGLEGDWVVPALSELALGETDPLVRATLIVGLFGGYSESRVADPRFLSAAESAIAGLVERSSDPHRVGVQAVLGAFSASTKQGSDLASLLVPHLLHSDNGSLLVAGYDVLGARGGADDVLQAMMSDHAHADGRMGALEGFRTAAVRGRVPPEDVARLGLEALGQEKDARNQVLLVELIGSAGGEPGLDALERIVRAGAEGTAGAVGPAATMLAVRGEPARALEVLDAALADPELSAATRAELYAALGAVDAPEAGAKLVALAGDGARSAQERLAGLRGLWNRPMDDALAGELEGLLRGDAPGIVRAESLRMLASTPELEGRIDARAIAVEDRDPAVRREAVVLAALEGGEDARGWLEERLLQDDEPEVQAAALGAMVMHARYGGDAGSVLGHLARVRNAVGDPAVLGRIEAAERWLAEEDPRRLEVGLAGDAEFYAKIASMTRGAAQREMRRRATAVERVIEAIRGGR